MDTPTVMSGPEVRTAPDTDPLPIGESTAAVMVGIAASSVWGALFGMAAGSLAGAVGSVVGMALGGLAGLAVTTFCTVRSGHTDAPHHR